MNRSRVGNFTSSGIAALMSNGKSKGSYGAPFYSYVNEKNMERRLGRSLSDDIYARPLVWGNLLEGRVFDLLGIEYRLCSQETIDHPTIECWRGSPDAEKFDREKTVADVKCPITLKSFCQMVDAWNMGGIGEIRESHKEGETYYWQLVSNAILTNSNFAELIVYVPYRSELEAIRQMAENFDGEKQHRLMWVALAADDELPFLPDGGHYKNLNVMRFAVPLADKVALTERVQAAKEMLIEQPKLITV